MHYHVWLCTEAVWLTKCPNIIFFSPSISEIYLHFQLIHTRELCFSLIRLWTMCCASHLVETIVCRINWQTSACQPSSSWRTVWTCNAPKLCMSVFPFTLFSLLCAFLWVKTCPSLPWTYFPNSKYSVTAHTPNSLLYVEVIRLVKSTKAATNHLMPQICSLSHS